MDASVQAIDCLFERARRERAPGFDCVPDGALWRLRIWGFLPRDWCGNLALHCFAAGLDVRNGEARLVEPNRWVGWPPRPRAGTGYFQGRTIPVICRACSTV